MRKFGVVLSALTLVGCGPSAEGVDNGGNDAIVPDTSAVNAASLSKPELASCLTAWKDVAIQGCVAMAGAEMTGDQSLLSDYKTSLSKIKRRCPSPSRIEWVAEQSAREATASFNSFSTEGDPPTFPELCRTNVTFRGNSEGYDRRVWDSDGLMAEANRKQQSDARLGERLSYRKKAWPGQEKDYFTEALLDMIAGKAGAWLCKSQDDDARIRAIYRPKADGRAATQVDVAVNIDGRNFVGPLFGHVSARYQAEVTNEGDVAMVWLKVIADLETLSDGFFAVQPEMVIGQEHLREPMMACEVSTR